MSAPANLTVGDSAVWNDQPFTDRTTGAIYDARTYALTYEFRGPGAPLTLNAVANGTGWSTTLTPAQGAQLVAGAWYWAAILTASGQRITIAHGEIEVAPDLTAMSMGYDGRTVAEIALADAESALASFKSSNGKVKRYTIGSRTFEFSSIAEIMQAISYWRARVMAERAARGISDGLGNPRNLMVRFG
jgi:hypothetical protein